MKRIALLSLPDLRASDPQFELPRIEYRTLVESAVRIPLDRQTGATIDEMRKGIRVLDALDGCPQTYGLQPEILTLEDADWEFLKQKVEKMPWTMTDRRFIQFYDDITSATEAPRDPTRTDGVASA